MKNNAASAFVRPQQGQKKEHHFLAVLFYIKALRALLISEAEARCAGQYLSLGATGR